MYRYVCMYYMYMYALCECIHCICRRFKVVVGSRHSRIRWPQLGILCIRAKHFHIMLFLDVVFPKYTHVSGFKMIHLKKRQPFKFYVNAHSVEKFILLINPFKNKVMLVGKN